MDDADYAALAVEWETMDSDEKEAALGRVVNNTLDAWGYPPVDVESGSLGGPFGEYDDVTDTVWFDSDTTLSNRRFSDALRTAFHEAGHALNDASEGAFFGEDDFDDYNAFAEGDELDEWEYVHQGHEDVVDFADLMVEDVRAAVDRVAPPADCGCAPSALVDSGSDASFTEDDFNFEIDFANATVTGAGDGGFSFEMDEAGVVVSP